MRGIHILLALIPAATALSRAADRQIGSTPGFFENKGQVTSQDGVTHQSVRFLTGQKNFQLFLLDNGLAYQFTEHGNRNDRNSGYEQAVTLKTFRIDLELAGANKACRTTAAGRSGNHTDFISRDTYDVHSFASVTYHDIYPGIDWILYFDNDVVKYDFLIHPGADPSRIKMKFSHQRNAYINDSGDFVIESPLGTIVDSRPESFQDGEMVSTRFLWNDGILTFSLGTYDTNRSLRIDPSVVWSTYYGGSDSEDGDDCVIDGNGNIYMCGTTASTNNIGAGGYQSSTVWSNYWEAFLVKFNSAGVRQWATYYGGTGAESGNSCAVDAAGNVYLVGGTSTSAGISTTGAHKTFLSGTHDGYIVKFSASGTRLWATYFGAGGYEEVIDCTVDASGDLYIAGISSSSSGIAVSGHQSACGGNDDAFLAKFDSAGTVIWSTYYGGSGSERGYACVTDPGGNVYLLGSSASTSSIASSGYQSVHGGSTDGMVAKFNTNGVRLWATYCGGSGADYIYGGVLDGFGNLVFTGATTSTNNIASGGFQNTFGGGTGLGDAMIVKMDSTGNRVWGSYYGGSMNERGNECVTDGNGNVYIVGQTTSTSNIASGGMQNTHSGDWDAMIVRFDKSGARKWGTYFGDAGADVAYAAAFDGSSHIYICGGSTSTTGIAVSGHQMVKGASSAQDGFLTKLFLCVEPPLPGIIHGDTSVCANAMVAGFSVTPVPTATAYTWGLPPGWSGNSSGNSLTASPGSSGIFSVSATSSCGVSEQRTLAVNVVPNPTITVSDGTVCAGQQFTLQPSGASSYTFSSGSNIVAPDSTTSYTVVGSIANCTSAPAIATVTAHALPILLAQSSSPMACAGDSVMLVVTGAATYTWSSGQTTAFFSVIATNSVYTVKGTDANGCVGSATVTQAVDICAGPESNDVAIPYTFYPNPANGHITINGPHGSRLSLTVTDLTGRMVFAKKNARPGETIQFLVAPGVYQVHLRTEKETVLIEKLLVE